MAADHHGPRKIGIYEGAGTIRAQSKILFPIVWIVVVLALIAVWLHWR
ncbi:MAG TPA: hypothetical protein VD978_35245 [Azospirillum sp.]|nr:hypothetical protein [Azospirillum sp.]